MNTIGKAIMNTKPAMAILIAPAGIPHKFVNSGKTLLRSINIHPTSYMTTEWLED